MRRSFLQALSADTKAASVALLKRKRVGDESDGAVRDFGRLRGVTQGDHNSRSELLAGQLTGGRAREANPRSGLYFAIKLPSCKNSADGCSFPRSRRLRVLCASVPLWLNFRLRFLRCLLWESHPSELTASMRVTYGLPYDFDLQNHSVLCRSLRVYGSNTLCVPPPGLVARFVGRLCRSAFSQPGKAVGLVTPCAPPSGIRVD